MSKQKLQSQASAHMLSLDIKIGFGHVTVTDLVHNVQQVICRAPFTNVTCQDVSMSHKKVKGYQKKAPSLFEPQVFFLDPWSFENCPLGPWKRPPWRPKSPVELLEVLAPFLVPLPFSLNILGKH